MSELSKFSIAELNNEIQSRYDRTLLFKKFKLTVDPGMGGGVYRSDEIFAGTNDKFYSRLKECFDATLIIDIGANIGLFTLEISTVFPEAKKILIEPNKLLTPLIRLNLEQNCIRNYQIMDCLVGDKQCKTQWQRNCNFSVDSRVTGLDKDFVYEEAMQVTLENMVDLNIEASSLIFIKIDTQGYEERVIKGGFNFLKKNTNYYIKMEFAPFWIESQNTNPEEFLSFMVENFDVVELPRSTFKADPINVIFDNKLLVSETRDFIEYVKGLGKQDKGWVELLIKNKQMDVKC